MSSSRTSAVRGGWAAVWRIRAGSLGSPTGEAKNGIQTAGAAAAAQAAAAGGGGSQQIQAQGAADAVAEGVRSTSDGWSADTGCGARFFNAQDAFHFLWNSLHGPAAWDANPWVVALTFTVQRGNIDALAANETPPGAHQAGLMLKSEGQ
jgi:hypothetical protein